jgi:hypothetical protein
VSISFNLDNRDKKEDNGKFYKTVNRVAETATQKYREVALEII